MKRINERLSKYFHSTLTVHSPVDVQTVRGNWERLSTGTYEVQQLDSDDRKFVIRTYGDEIVVEEIELDTIVSGPEATITDGAPGSSGRDDSYITGPDDEDEDESYSRKTSGSDRSSAASNSGRSSSRSSSSSSKSTGKSSNTKSTGKKSTSKSTNKKSTSKSGTKKKSTSKSGNTKKSTSKSSNTKKSTTKKSTPKSNTSKRNTKTTSTRKKKKSKESVAMETREVILNNPTLINETVYPKGTKVILHEVQDPAGQRTFGFDGEADVVHDQIPDTEVIEAEDLMDIFPDKVSDVGGVFVLSETGKSFELNSDLAYDTLPSPREVAEALGYEYRADEWLSEVLQELDPEAFDNWMNDQDPENLFNIQDWLQENGNGEWISHGADNTYNGMYLGPFDVDFGTVEYDGTYYTFYKVHLGGDIRGGYSEYYVREDSDESDFLYAFTGGANVTFEFEDGSMWQFFSQQEFDVWLFELANENEIEPGSHASQFLPLLDEYSSYDEAIEELWNEVE